MSPIALKITNSQLYAQQFVQINNKKNIKVPHYWFFVKLIQRRQVDIFHKGPVVREMFRHHTWAIKLLERSNR